MEESWEEEGVREKSWEEEDVGEVNWEGGRQESIVQSFETLHGTDETVVVLFSGSQSTTTSLKQTGYRTVSNAEMTKKIGMGPNFPVAQISLTLVQ